MVQGVEYAPAYVAREMRCSSVDVAGRLTSVKGRGGGGVRIVQVGGVCSGHSRWATSAVDSRRRQQRLDGCTCRCSLCGGAGTFTQNWT
jgi:hypothetical protein